MFLIFLLRFVECANENNVTKLWYLECAIPKHVQNFPRSKKPIEFLKQHLRMFEDLKAEQALKRTTCRVINFLEGPGFWALILILMTHRFTLLNSLSPTQESVSRFVLYFCFLVQAFLPMNCDPVEQFQEDEIRLAKLQLDVDILKREVDKRRLFRNLLSSGWFNGRL